MTEIFHYDTTYERADHEGYVTSSLDVRIEYTYQPGVSARIRYDENDHPSEPASIEICGIREETWAHGRGKDTVYKWTKIPSQDLYAELSEWVMGDHNLVDLLIESAMEDLVGREEAAAEHAYETRRELADLNAAEDRLARRGDE